MKPTFVGRSVRRLEDLPLVTGKGAFAADISFPQQLHMRVVRSAYAHAKIRSIDVAAARAVPGVHAGWTAADVEKIPPIDFRLTRVPGLEPYRQRVLASDRVRYVGEPIAAVFAGDAYLAEDAAELVSVEVEELPVRLRAEEEPGEFAPGHSTEAAVIRKGYGDVEAAFRDAHAIVALDLKVGRHSGVPMETRGAIARYDAARDVLGLYGAAKVPHWNRDQIARMLGRAPASVQLYEGHVGGGFGVRGELYPEDVLVCAAALEFRRPVKWIEDRREHLIAANHSRQQQHRIRAAVDAQGNILAIDDSSSTTRVPICVPTRSRSRTSPPRCCPAPIGFPRIAPSAGSGSPTRRRAALIGRRAGSRARSRASVSWTRSRPRPASMRSRCAAATSLRRPRCRTGACSARSARRWCSIPAITQDCSTRRSRRSAGRRSRPRCASGAPRASASARAWRCSSKKAGSGRPTPCESPSIRPARSKW